MSARDPRPIRVRGVGRDAGGVVLSIDVDGVHGEAGPPLKVVMTTPARAVQTSRAPRAADLRIINRVVPKDALPEATEALARRLASGPRQALARTKAAGKVAGIYAPTGERAADFAKRGYDFIAIGSDLAFLRMGAAAMLKTAGA